MDDRPGNGTWPPESFLGRLTTAERDALLARGGYAAYQPGQHLLVDGDRGEFVVLVHAGQVKVVMQDEHGVEHLVGVRARGSLLGEQSYVDGQPRSASVVAINTVWASSIARQNFGRYLQEYPRVSMEIARVLANRLRASDQTGRDIHSTPVPVRVVNLLLSLTEDFGEPGVRPEQGTVIPLNQAQMAQLAHAAEVTVNRVLREFKDRRVVRTAYRRIEVPCGVCLGRLAIAVSADPKGGSNAVLGCGGTNSHR